MGKCGGDKTRFVRGQKQRRIGGVATVAHEGQRNARLALLQQALHVAACALPGQAHLDHGGVQLARHHGVDTDILLGILHGEHAGELDHRGLGGCVGNLRRAGPAQRRGGRDVDYRAATLSGVVGQHVWQHVFAGEKHAFEVVVDQRVPHRLAHLHRAAFGRAADVVDQHVDAAKFGDALRHHLGDRGTAGHVAITGLEVAAGFSNQAFSFGKALQFAVKTINPGAFLGKTHGGGAAIAPAGTDRAAAGDQGDFAFESSVGLSARPSSLSGVHSENL